MMIKKTLTLGNGLEIPAVGLDCKLIELENDFSAELVKGFVDAGIRLFDVTGHLGDERGLLNCLRKTGVPEEQFTIITKAWFGDVKSGLQMRSLTRSLYRLDGHIDIYLVGYPVYGSFIAAYRELEKMYREGRFKAIGVNGIDCEQLQELLNVCDIKPHLIQTEYEPHMQRGGLRDLCIKNGIAMQAVRPLGNPRIGVCNDRIVKQIAKRHKIEPARIVMRWALEMGVGVLPHIIDADGMNIPNCLYNFKLKDDERDAITARDVDLLHGGPYIPNNPNTPAGSY